MHDERILEKKRYPITTRGSPSNKKAQRFKVGNE